MSEEQKADAPAPEQKEAVKHEVQFIPSAVEILDPNLSNVKCVAKMARICYKNEKETSEEDDTRLIKSCIKRGHTSILEHGAISLVIPEGDTPQNRALFMKLLGKKDARINYPTMGGIFIESAVAAQDRYMTGWIDPTIIRRHCKRLGLPFDESKQQSASPAILADIRAWRDVMQTRISYSLDSDTPVLFLLGVKILVELNKLESTFFQDLIDSIDNNFLAKFKPNDSNNHSDIYRVLAAKFFDSVLEEHVKDSGETIKNYTKKLTCENLCEFFFEGDWQFYAEEADPSAKLSVIFTTNRAVTHQLVRHRLDVGYSQESQRYVNFSSKGCTAITPLIDPVKYEKFAITDFGRAGELKDDLESKKIMTDAIVAAFEAYNKLIETGLPPEVARNVLPNACATKIGVTWLRHSGFTNLTFWRMEGHAQYDIRKLVSTVVAQGMLQKHPFLMALSPSLTAEWIMQIKNTTPGVITEQTAKSIVDECRKRSEHIKQLVEKQRAQLKAAAEAHELAQKKRIEAELAERKAAEAAKAAEDQLSSTSPETPVAPEVAAGTPDAPAPAPGSAEA